MKKNWIRHIVIYTFALLCILPLAIMIFYSIRDTQGTYTLQQYIKALFFSSDFLRGYWNALMYTGFIILFNVPLSLLSAYGFSRFKFKGNRLLFWFYIVLMLMPFQATIVPQYLTLKALHLINHPMAVILPNVFATFGTVLMAQYMRGLGKELFDAGKIDGFSDLHLFVRVIAPMCKSLIFALTVLSFINYWSMIEQPLVFISDTADMPLAVTLNNSRQFRSISFAIGVIFSILPLMLYQFSYQDLVYGISAAGGVNTRGNSSSNRSSRSNRKKALNWMIGFMIFMFGVTLATQKIDEITLTTVETQSAESKDVKSDIYDINSPSLGYFTYVVPKKAVFTAGVDSFVYIIEEERSRLARNELVKMTAPVSVDNGVEAAVTGMISKEYKVAVKSDYPLHQSRFVKLYDYKNPPALDNEHREKVLFAVPKTQQGFLEALDNRPTDIPFNVDISEQNNRVIVTVENQALIYDPFLAERFLESAQMHFWVDAPEVEVFDFTHFGAVINDLRRLILFLALTFGFSLLIYVLYQLIRTQICWFKFQLKTQYAYDIFHNHLSWVLEQLLANGIVIALSVIAYAKMVEFKFALTARDVIKYRLLKWRIIDASTESVMQTSYGNDCFTLLANERLKTVGLMVLLGLIFVLAIMGVKKYFSREVKRWEK